MTKAGYIGSAHGNRFYRLEGSETLVIIEGGKEHPTPFLKLPSREEFNHWLCIEDKEAD